MPANRGLFVLQTGTAPNQIGTTPIEARLALAALVAENSPGVPRQGLLLPSTGVIVSGSASMSYNIAACQAVSNRAFGGGIYLFSVSGTTAVATDAAPGSNSRWDLIWIKQSDPETADGVTTASSGVTRGTAAATPTKPYANVPTGAMVLAEALVQSGATATNSASVQITQVWRYSALRGTPIPVRNLTERGEITPSAGTQVQRIDLGQTALNTWNGASWVLSGAMMHMECTGPAVSGQPAGDGKAWGNFNIDNTKTFNNSFIAPSGDGKLKILEAGVYDIHALYLPAGQPGNLNIGMGVTPPGGTGQNTSVFTRTGGYGAVEANISAPGLYLGVGDELFFYASSSNGPNFGSRVWVTKR